MEKAICNGCQLIVFRIIKLKSYYILIILWIEIDASRSKTEALQIRIESPNCNMTQASISQTLRDQTVNYKNQATKTFYRQFAEIVGET